ncbi:MAG: hypothetical protein KDB07_03570 [Planctomycetes bacterium]|nr:hypothetical protein [Planctomycetota bacterium]
MALGFSEAWLLLGLVGLPLLYWLARRATRRIDQQLGSLMIWARVATQVQAKPQRRLDRVAIFLMLCLSLSSLGAADPQLGQGESAPDLAVLYDDGIGGALVGHTTVAGQSAPTPDPTHKLTPARFRAWLADQTAAKLIVASPMELGPMPSGVVQVSKPFEREALALSFVDVSASRLFARSTRANAEFMLALDGGAAIRLRAQGSELLTMLPREGKELVLQRVDAQGRPDAPAYRLRARAPVKVFAPLLQSEVQQALEAAFDASLTFVEDAGEATFGFGSDLVPASLVVAASDEATADLPESIGGLALDPDSAFSKLMPQGWLTTLPAKGLAPQAGQDILLAYAAEGDAALIQRKDSDSIRTTIDIFGRYQRAEWLPLFLAAAIEESLGRDLLGEGQWVLEAASSTSQENWLAPEAWEVRQNLGQEFGEVPLKSSLASVAWIFNLLALLVLLALGWVERNAFFQKS